ncbi:protein farnesyltransferase subunit beta [Diaporthe amygdali]|uniref:protein farnesyltransferase subunit beta n=1 Tax=Phomopsis amygdali TaxID=1214568 RepID=UPI0022FE86B7|nr:protein farnesyltransferase subunit beta [Diaporthe amygdali]KAJ0110114.1 protein farnesyltransferase subunit beta [Diaporthe amygdali]
MIPDLFTSLPPVRDELQSTTTVAQDETVSLCLPFLSGEKHDDCNDYGVPHLDRERHIKFLHKQLGKLPSPFIAADASRPWFLSWSLNGLSLLGEDVSSYRAALIDTARSMQNDTGGFGGGNGQMSHLATTYAMVLSLALVGGDSVYEVVDRRAMWKWLCSLKQPSGGFQMAVGGEVDIRGAYCAAVVVSLLNLPTDLTPESPAWTPDHPTLFTKLPEYVQRCQTFEGGISAHPDAEAHGAYAFCALGCLAILDSPDRIIPSHWVGGCWPLIEAALAGDRGDHVPPLGGDEQPGHKHKLPLHGRSLYSREGLIRYIMCCCQDQSKRGGLRDKPSRPSDGYHTCYVLAGLSSAQHKSELVNTEAPGTNATASTAGDAGSPGLGVGEQPYLTTSWSVTPYLDEAQVFDEQDRLEPLHPLYALPVGCVADIKRYFDAKTGF